MGRFEEIAVKGRAMRTYVDAPATGGARGGVVVMCHGPGVDDFIHSRVEDLARHGFAAAAPDVFHRQPDDGAGFMARIARLHDDEILADADAAVGHLRALHGPPLERLAVLGFCMGGRNSYLLAGARPDRLERRGRLLRRQHHEGLLGRRPGAVRAHRADPVAR